MIEGEPPLFADAVAAVDAACSRAGVSSSSSSSFAALAPLIDARDDVRALAFTALFGRRLADRGAFWFPQRETRFGVALGFRHVLLPIDPDALIDGDVDARLGEILASLPPPSSSSQPQLDAGVYREAFDPELVQFLVLDARRVNEALAMSDGAAADVADAAINAAALAPEQKDVARDLLDVAKDRTRAWERFVRVYACRAAGAPAEEGFWADVVFRLPGVERRGGLLGVLSVERTRAVVGGDKPRLINVEADELPAVADTALDRGADVAPAAARLLRELRSMTARLSATSVLALRRLTVVDASHEPILIAVNAALR